MAYTVTLPELPYTSVKENKVLDGVQFVVTFANGFGASVVNHKGSYGLELAVLDHNGNLTYETPITGDVLGHLNAERLEKALRDIEALSPNAIQEEKERVENERKARFNKGAKLARSLNLSDEDYKALQEFMSL